MTRFDRLHLLTFSLCISLIALQSHAAQVTTIAGSGEKGFAGDGGHATSAQLADPGGLVRGPDGAIYVCDTANHAIRRIGTDGVITTVAGTGKRGLSGDSELATKATLNEPYEVRFDVAGNMFIVERLNHDIRRVDAKTQIITTIAGTGKPGFSGDGGPATAALLKEPHSIQFDKAGDLFICDVVNHRVRKIDMKTGIITTFAGSGEKGAPVEGGKITASPVYGPRALDFDADGNLWVALREGNAIIKIDCAAGIIHHIAGTGKKGFTGNGGPALQATLSGPKGLSVGPTGNVYIADTESHSIRMIDVKANTLDVVVGIGTKGNGPDGDALKCKLTRPHGIFADRDGTLLIGDTENQRVRLVKPDGK